MLGFARRRMLAVIAVRRDGLGARLESREAVREAAYASTSADTAAATM
jgi:hypothetical protein